LSHPVSSPGLRIIGRVHSDFSSKFGIPRQSSLIDCLKATIVFEPEFRNPDFLRGIEGFSHLWVIWNFSQSPWESGSPLVRPPRLGGTEKKGIWATRSPFRPNGLGLSSVQLSHVELTLSQGPVVHIRGGDMADQTPVYDIKPYLPFTDSHPAARGGFTDTHGYAKLTVDWGTFGGRDLPADPGDALTAILEHDPRPAYHHDPEREYGFEYGGYHVGFRVAGQTAVVTALRQL